MKILNIAGVSLFFITGLILLSGIGFIFMGHPEYLLPTAFLAYLCLAGSFILCSAANGSNGE